jgi:amino acid permease
MSKQLLEATATLTGTVIGAGLLAIPFVVAKAGFWTGIIDIIIIGAILTIIHLYLGEIALRTKGFHQLTGYARRYLGKFGKKIMFLAMIFGIYGALVAYLIGEGHALNALLGIGSPLIYSLIFFAVAAALVYFGLKAVGESEISIVPVMIILIAIIAVFSFTRINTANFTGMDLSSILIPYGTIFFAFFGTAAIPEMREELVKNERHMKRAIILGMLIPMIIYIIFTFIIVGVSGINTTQIATIGLGHLVGKNMLILGNLFAVFAMATCFLTLALAMKQMYTYDYKFNKKISWMITCFVPLVIFFIVRNFAGFGEVIGITGAIAGGLTSFLVVLIAWKAKKLGNREPEYSITKNKVLGIVLMIIFLIGIIYGIIRIF